MKKAISILGAMIMLLMNSIISCAAETNNMRQGICPQLDEYFSQTYYASSTLPQEVIPGSPLTQSRPLEISDAADQTLPAEFATYCEISFVSGSELLKKALVLNQYGADGRIYLELDYNCLTEPGEALFDITVMSNSYLFRTVKTLRVESFRDHTPFYIQKEGCNIQIFPGETVSALRASEKAIRMAEDSTGLSTASWAGTEKYKNLRSVYASEIITEAYGQYDIEILFSYANVSCMVPVFLQCLPYHIEYSGTPFQGQSIRFMMINDEAGGVVDCKWSVTEGQAEIDDSGLLTIPDDAAVGEKIVVQAVPVSGGTPLEKSIRIQEAGKLFKDCTFKQTAFLEGFSVDLPESEEWTANVVSNADEHYLGYSERISDHKDKEVLEVYMTEIPDFVEEAEKALAYYDDSYSELSEKENGLQMKDVEIQNHPARLALYYVDSPRNDGSDAVDHIVGGMISYARDRKVLFLRLNLYNPDEEEVTFADLKELIKHISYAPEQAGFREADTDFEIAAEGDQKIIVGGETLNMTVTFSNSDYMNARNKYDKILWSVVDAETGETTEKAKMANNILSVSPSLAEETELKVIAQSVAFPELKREYQITAVPRVNKLTVNPSKLQLWAGTGESAEITYETDPKNLPPERVTVASENEEIVMVKPLGKGKAEIHAVGAGKTTVRVSETGGERVYVPVTVLIPVETLTIKTDRSAKLGDTPKFSAELYPENASNKHVTWSIDVDESIANIWNNGLLKIDANAPKGTEITVTCTAEGAPNPVVETMKIILE